MCVFVYPSVFVLDNTVYATGLFGSFTVIEL